MLFTRFLWSKAVLSKWTQAIDKEIQSLFEPGTLTKISQAEARTYDYSHLCQKLKFSLATQGRGYRLSLDRAPGDSSSGYLRRRSSGNLHLCEAHRGSGCLHLHGVYQRVPPPV